MVFIFEKKLFRFHFYSILLLLFLQGYFLFFIYLFHCSLKLFPSLSLPLSFFFWIPFFTLTSSLPSALSQHLSLSLSFLAFNFRSLSFPLSILLNISTSFTQCSTVHLLCPRTVSEWIVSWNADKNLRCATVFRMFSLLSPTSLSSLFPCISSSIHKPISFFLSFSYSICIYLFIYLCLSLFLPLTRCLSFSLFSLLSFPPDRFPSLFFSICLDLYFFLFLFFSLCFLLPSMNVCFFPSSSLSDFIPPLSLIYPLSTFIPPSRGQGPFEGQGQQKIIPFPVCTSSLPHTVTTFSCFVFDTHYLCTVHMALFILLSSYFLTLSKLVCHLPYHSISPEFFCSFSH